MLYEILGFSEGEFPAGLGWHDKIVAGFPQASVWSVARYLGVQASDTAALVGVPHPALSWRQRSSLLSFQVSDRLFNLAKAFQRLMVPLKDAQQVQAWLRNPQPSLGNRLPVLLLMTQPGAQEVFAAIDAIKVLKGVEMNPLFDDALDDAEAADTAGEPSEDDPVEIR